MKKLLAGAASSALFFFFSCNNANSPTVMKPVSDSSMTTTTTVKERSQADKNTDNIRAIYKGIENGDMSAMDGFVADDAVDHAGPHGEMKGRDSIKKMLGDMHNHVSNLKIDLISEATSADGNYQFALSRFTGTTKDASMGAPANTSLDETSVDVMKISNGMVTDHWDFENPQKMREMMMMHHKK